MCGTGGAGVPPAASRPRSCCLTAAVFGQAGKSKSLLYTPPSFKTQSLSVPLIEHNHRNTERDESERDGAG